MLKAGMLVAASVVIVVRVVLVTGGGTEREGGGGSGSGACGGTAAASALFESPTSWKSGGSTYLLKSTFPPKSTIRRRCRNAEIVKKREARIRLRKRS
jgi:hypothetical protein